MPHLAIGVCSWSLEVKSVPELRRLLDRLGINTVQIACGDPHHASWAEGDRFPTVANAAGFEMTGAMLGFPGEDYTTPRTIHDTGGFGDPTLRAERLQRLQWGLERTRALGLSDLTLHAGFIPPVGDADRKAFLQTLSRVNNYAVAQNVTIGLETGQETANLLRTTLDELQCPNLKVNFDPANMLLYDMGDPLEAVKILWPDIRSVHVKDAKRPTTPGTWGDEVPLGSGQVDIRRFIKTLQHVGYNGPLCIERGVGIQEQRFADVAAGIKFLRECMV
jgi:L-ribulose-5-phosphate 3-epimerase